LKKIDDIREIQKISLSLLNVFDDLCKSNHLRYYLAWGTLLGAIRHKGFIPWDDDIDLMMPRKDFDRLIELNVQEPVKGVRFYSFSQDNLYDNVNCRLSDERTLVDISKIENPVRQGIWLTIFPIDALPDDQMERKSFLRRIYWRYKLVLALSMKDEYLDTKPLIQKLGAKLLKRMIGIHGRKLLYRQLHTIMKSYETVDTMEVGILSISTGNKTHFSRNSVEKTIQTVFEGKQYPIPAGYDEILTNTYGDYLQLPPLEQRVPKHDFDAYYK